MKKALLKDSLKQIKKTHKRFISILLMAFLGVGFFAGVRATSPDMKKTVDKYFDNMKVYDLKVVSTLGLTQEDLLELSKLDGVEKAYGLFSKDVFLKINDEENVVKVLPYNKEVNIPDLVEGKFPENENDCIIEYYMNEYAGIKIGDEIEIIENLEEDEDPSFKNTKLKVVGITKSPIYISRDRGTTSLGTGKINYYIYVNENNISSDIFTEIDIFAKDSFEVGTISKEYDEIIENVKENINGIKEQRQDARYLSLVNEANEKLEDSEKELADEKKEAEEKIADAERKIADGKKEIKDGENKIKDSEKELSEGKDKASVEFANADAEISSNETKLAEARMAITDAENMLASKKAEAEAGINQIKAGIAEIDSQLASLNETKTAAEGVLSSLNTIDTTITSLNKTLEEYNTQLENEPENTELSTMIDYVNGQIQTLNVQKNELLAYGITQEKLNAINAGINECNSKKTELQNQLNAINKGIEDGQKKIDQSNYELHLANQSLAARKSRTCK